MTIEAGRSTGKV